MKYRAFRASHSEFSPFSRRGVNFWLNSCSHSVGSRPSSIPFSLYLSMAILSTSVDQISSRELQCPFSFSKRRIGEKKVHTKLELYFRCDSACTELGILRSRCWKTGFPLHCGIFQWCVHSDANESPVPARHKNWKSLANILTKLGKTEKFVFVFAIRRNSSRIIITKFLVVLVFGNRTDKCWPALRKVFSIWGKWVRVFEVW